MTAAPRYEVDEYIQNHPDLLKAIQIATEELAERAASTGSSPTFVWRVPPADEPVIELSMSETTETGAGTAKRRFPLRYMADPVNRDISVLRVWGDLLAERSKRNMTRIGELVRALEEEERNGQVAQ